MLLLLLLFSLCGSVEVWKKCGSGSEREEGRGRLMELLGDDANHESCRHEIVFFSQIYMCIVNKIHRNW